MREADELNDIIEEAGTEFCWRCAGDHSCERLTTILERTLQLRNFFSKNKHQCWLGERGRREGGRNSVNEDEVRGDLLV